MTELPARNPDPVTDAALRSAATLYRASFELGRLQGTRSIALKQFEHRFGIPDLEIWSWVQASSVDQVVQFALTLLDATSLADFGGRLNITRESNRRSN